MAAPRAFFLVGPTAVGKSAVAQRLAEEDHAGILSVDSMQVYRGMDIGTAKPDAAERTRVPYWGLDCVDPSESFSVGRFLDCARDACAAAARAGHALLAVGGTGLYVKCLVQGLETAPAVDPVLRARLLRLQEEQGVPGLQAELRRLSPERLAQLADPKNPRRLLRALELAASGQPIVPRPPARPMPRLTGLRMEPALLEERIRTRVQAMYEGGLLEEARLLRSRSEALSITAAQAIGYAEAFAVLDDTCSLEEAMAATMMRTRQLSKRQLTWFRHQGNMAWIDVTPDMTIPDIAAAVRAQWKLDGPTPLII